MRLIGRKVLPHWSERAQIKNAIVQVPDMIKKKYERLAALFFHFKGLGYTQSSFGALLGITQAQLSRLLRGESGITRQHSLLLEARLGVNPRWLESGQGEMFLPGEDTKRLDEYSGKILQNYEKLSPHYREILYILSESLVDRHFKETKSGKNRATRTDLAAEPNPEYSGPDKKKKGKN